LVRDGGKIVHCPAFEVPVVDVTAAGDVFNAGFLYGFLNGWDLRKCAEFGNACGAISVTKVGVSGMMTSVQEVETFLGARSRGMSGGEVSV
jgi:sugar/nucleoside kinase (ribokinase family)